AARRTDDGDEFTGADGKVDIPHRLVGATALERKGDRHLRQPHRRAVRLPHLCRSVHAHPIIERPPIPCLRLKQETLPDTACDATAAGPMAAPAGPPLALSRWLPTYG